MIFREEVARRARERLCDERVIAFLHTLEPISIPVWDVWDVWSADERLQPGKPLDEMFYTGSEYGFVLGASRSNSDFQIGFGYQRAPSMSSGRIWHVAFEGNQIISSKRTGEWFDGWRVCVLVGGW